MAAEHVPGITDGKLTLHIASPEEAEQAEFVVCANLTDPMILPGNLTGRCAGCQTPLQFAPSAPKLPPKLCLRCVLLRINPPAGRA